MLYLLQLEEEQNRRILPVAERTAARLEEALLSPDDSSRKALLTRALVSDPILALWAVRATGLSDRSEPTSADATAVSLGEFLLERLVQHSVRLDQGATAYRRLDSWDAARYGCELARVVRHARLVAKGEDAAQSSAYFSALVHGAEELMHSCPQQTEPRHRLLPAFEPVAPPLARLSRRDASSDDDLTDYFLDEVPNIDTRLLSVVNKLLDLRRQVQSFSDRIEREKLAALKELAYGASHEINNPLANIAARAQTLLKEETDPERRQKLISIHQQAMRAHEMIADLMLFARPPKLVLERCCLRRLVGDVVAELADQARRHQIALAYEPGTEEVEVRADVTQLALAVKAVITNALEAVVSTGHVDIRIERRIDEQGTWGVVVVRDDGPGISPHVRRHIFDPFFSGREAGRGLGFGLSKCWRILTEHGGYVQVESDARSGAEFVLAVPIWQEPICSELSE